MISAPTTAPQMTVTGGICSKLIVGADTIRPQNDTDMKNLPTRKPNRLKGYNYTHSGAYFVTICAKERAELFSSIPDNVVGADIIRPQLTQIGSIAENGIMNIPKIHPGVDVTHFVIMPNHIHIIIEIVGDAACERQNAAPTGLTVSKIVGYFKQFVSRQVGFSPWQKSFHDHIIRSEEDYIRIAEYIDTNPAMWKDDCFYPQ